MVAAAASPDQDSARVTKRELSKFKKDLRILISLEENHTPPFVTGSLRTTAVLDADQILNRVEGASSAAVQNSARLTRCSPSWLNSTAEMISAALFWMRQAGNQGEQHIPE